jgi:photoactive yellow protein
MVTPELTVMMGFLDALPIGVVVLDREGRVVHYNRYEEELANRKRAQVLGKRFFHEVAPCMNVRELGLRFADEIGREEIDTNIEFHFPFPDRPREVRVHLRSFEVGGEPYGFLLIEDVSAQRAVERMKTSLGDLLVHDLKSPLSVVTVALQFLRDRAGVQADVEGREEAEDGLRAARRLSRMITNLLDLTRLETASLPLRRMTVDLRAISASVVAESMPIARSRSVALVEDSEAAPVLVEVDLDVVRRALDNLVDNAIDYTRSGGAVSVRTGARDESAWIEVADEGPGIAEDVRERVFDKYVQLDGLRRNGANRGLGLTFVRLAARAHGGEVSVRCPPQGGSVFRIELPRT